MSQTLSYSRPQRRRPMLTLGRTALVFAAFAWFSTLSSVVAPYTSRLPPAVCFVASTLVTYGLTLLGLLLAVLGIILDDDDAPAVRALSVNLVTATGPFAAFLVYLVLHHR